LDVSIEAISISDEKRQELIEAQDLQYR